jgi:hypothetical protein
VAVDLRGMRDRLPPLKQRTPADDLLAAIHHRDHASVDALLSQHHGDLLMMAEVADRFLASLPLPRNPKDCYHPAQGQHAIARVLMLVDGGRESLPRASAAGLIETVGRLAELGAAVPPGTSLTPSFVRQAEKLLLDDLRTVVRVWYAAGAGWRPTEAEIAGFRALVDGYLFEAEEALLGELAADPAVDAATRTTAWCFVALFGDAPEIPPAPPIPETHQPGVAALLATAAVSTTPERAVRILAVAGALA